MKKDINVNKAITKLLHYYEKKYRILTFNIKKQNEDFYLVNVDNELLEEGNVSVNDVLQKNINEICVNLKVAQSLHNLYNLVWTNQCSNLFMVYLNSQLYVVFLTLIENDNKEKMIKGYCIPLDESEGLSLTNEFLIFQRSDFIS